MKTTKESIHTLQNEMEIYFICNYLLRFAVISSVREFTF